MKKEEMRGIIDKELEHIPPSFRGSDQNLLRACYNFVRMADLAQNPACPSKDALTKAIEAMKKDKPDFSPMYDRDFFEKSGG